MFDTSLDCLVSLWQRFSNIFVRQPQFVFQESYTTPTHQQATDCRAPVCFNNKQPLPHRLTNTP